PDGHVCRRCLNAGFGASEPSTDLHLIRPIGIAEESMERFLLGCNLESTDVRSKGKWAEKWDPRTQPDGPCAEEKDETNVHWVARDSIYAGGDQRRGRLRLQRVDRRFAPTKCDEACEVDDRARERKSNCQENPYEARLCNGDSAASGSPHGQSNDERHNRWRN